MAFSCPDCLGEDTLEIITSIQLPPDSRSDDIMLQVVRCSHCGFHALTVYEESRRGALGSEAWDHTGYRTAKEQVGMIQKAIQECPQPLNPGCLCAAHRRLGIQDASGRWDGLRDIQVESIFVLHLIL